ncbi:type II 3-dehydroquinate dehydratase [Lipingzhangella sp. LS1_29]|uniref:3-dehydroquinate dehydratase n=1 Tax=Lipingzhangella rawalii TaxID=2055835 RepID=A0ABU2H100_9ACTN|nr:type II 3-dehydroquinate dehydratase [Lipingzhangella rawalii]MDS1268978.1 type II 3-dehydroquinate dehydratase [Lipingzhangella rawalii]
MAESGERPTVLLLNGPNLNLLGQRDPHQYGSTTLPQVEQRLRDLGAELGVRVTCVQSNHEGELVEQVHAAHGSAGIVCNPGAYAHTSVALRDAVDAVPTPYVEVHISNVYARESFRHTSLTAAVASGYIVGCGVFGYELGLRAVIERWTSGQE